MGKLTEVLLFLYRLSILILIGLGILFAGPYYLVDEKEEIPIAITIIKYCEGARIK